MYFVGIDVGLIDFIVTSDDERIAAPKFLRKAERKLQSAQRRVSRRKKGSNRRKKAIKNLGIQHKKVSFIHRLNALEKKRKNQSKFYRCNLVFFKICCNRSSIFYENLSYISALSTHLKISRF